MEILESKTNKPDLKGPKGERGERGLKGDKGDKGERGEKGDQGERGEADDWLNGSGKPDESLGSIGDYYLNNDSGEYYEKIGRRLWKLLGTLKGEPGFNGAPGERGADGAAGSQGAQGIQGEQGPQGIQGEIGDTGPQGVAGPNVVTASTTTDITGILKGNGSNVGTATAGTDYVAPNGSITGATKTKITYDAKGLVTAGADATTSDIGEGTNLYFTDERVDDRVNTLIQDSTATAPGITWTYDDTANTLTPEVSQTYQTYIFNSSGSQGGNRYNDQADLIAALQDQGGPKLLIGEQDENFSSGAFDFTEVTLQGKGLQEYNAGGWTWTFSGTATITGLWPGLQGIRVVSTKASSAVYSPSSTFGTWVTEIVANIHSTYYPFISSSVAGQNIIAVRESGRFAKLAGGVENIEFTGGAFAQTIILSLGDGATVTDDVLKSTNAQVYVPIIGSVNQALANWPPSHTNLNVGFQMELNLTNSLALLNTPAGNIAATTTQDAINELDTEKIGLSIIDAKGDLLGGTADNTVDNLTVGANNTVLVADSGETTGLKWARRPRVLDSNTTAVGNVGTGEDDLITYTIPASTLLNTGDSIAAEMYVDVANNANQKRLKVWFGSATIFDTQPTGLLVATAYAIKFDIRIFKDGSNTQRYTVDYTANGGLLGSLYGTATQTDTSTIVIKCTGETNAASNDDVRQRFQFVKLDPV